MEVTVRLHGRLRDVLPRENKGRTIVTLPDGSSVGDLIKVLEMQTRTVLVAVNELQEVSLDHELQNGDKVSFFAPIAGG
jgi:sulfur carrier protein ThiS